MPTPPQKGESKDEFIARCIKYLKHEGKTNEQASGQCYSIWKNRNKVKSAARKRTRR